MSKKTIKDLSIAIKICFSYHFNEQDLEDIISILRVTELDETIELNEDIKFLVESSLEKKEQLDAQIKINSKKISLQRLSVIDRIILRVSLVHIQKSDITDHEQTLELVLQAASEFCTEKSLILINGILDAMINHKLKNINT